MISAHSPPGVLYVDDDPDDTMLMQRAWNQSGAPCTLICTADGTQAVSCLRYSQCEIKLVILDLKMPRLDGFETINLIKNCPELSDLKVVVLTHSSAKKDHERAKLLGAGAVLIKPLAAAARLDLVKALAAQYLQ